MMRRLILRRGLTALLGGAAALAAGRPVGGNEPCEPPRDIGLASSNPIGGDEHETRRAWAEPFFKQQRAIEKERYLRWKSHNEIDPTLTVLLSTSPTWRAGVMYSRHKARSSIMDSLSEKVDAIWQEPLAKLQNLVASWIRGDA
jgi:hypothetical protein